MDRRFATNPEENTSTLSDSVIDLIEYLHQLLPYDPATRFRNELQNGLNEYQLLLNALLQAIKYYNAGKLEKFDSLVGENACQIRAIYIAWLATKKLNFSILQDQILLILDKLNSISHKRLPELFRKRKSLAFLLESEHLLLKLSREELFLVQSFLLSEAKKMQPNNHIISSLLIRDEVDLQKIKLFGNVTTNFVKNLIKRLRMQLSLDSIHFIRKLAQNTSNNHLIRMTSDEFIKIHNHCFCIPCFWTFKSILTMIHNEKIPIIVHVNFMFEENEGKYRYVNETFLIFKTMRLNNSNSILIETNLENFDLNQPAMIIRGIAVITGSMMNCSSWRQALSKYTLDEIILATAADHRQYPESRHNEKINELEDSEFEKYRHLAKTGGFSLDNPRTLLMNHIYASIPNHLSFIDRQSLSNTSISVNV